MYCVPIGSIAQNVGEIWTFWTLFEELRPVQFVIYLNLLVFTSCLPLAAVLRKSEKRLNYLVGNYAHLNVLCHLSVRPP